MAAARRARSSQSHSSIRMTTAARMTNGAASALLTSLASPPLVFFRSASAIEISSLARSNEDDHARILSEVSLRVKVDQPHAGLDCLSYRSGRDKLTAEFHDYWLLTRVL